MKPYKAPRWKEGSSSILSNPLMLWAYPLALVEPPNYRRGGWSMVGTMVLTDSDNTPVTVYVKRQESHGCRHPYWPWIRIPTLRREYRNMLKFASVHIPIPQLCYYVEWESKAILVTEALTNTIDLQKYCDAGLIKDREFSVKLARTIAAMHQCRWQHTSLYPKHILIDTNTGSFYFIDLENARRRWIKHRVSVRDLDSLNRRLVGVSILKRARFLRYYLIEMKKIKNFSSYFRTLCKKYQKKH